MSCWLQGKEDLPHTNQLSCLHALQGRTAAFL